MLLSHVAQRTPWFKQHLYHRLLAGDTEQKLQAAGLLARVGGEPQLLQALRASNEDVHQTARRALEHLWFSAAGSEALAMLDSAYRATDEKRYDDALNLLDEIVARYPSYAEAWNRRGAVLWQLGNYQRSLNDCQRAVALNPNHYGAWQGLGVCHLQLGDFAAACRSLHTALRIDPHDQTTRRCLEKCEELLRLSPGGRSAINPSELL